MRWRQAAACAQADPDLFFPAGNSRLHPEIVAEAKRVCERCAVRGECLEFALTNRQEEGIWGGLTPDELRRLRRLRQRERDRSLV